MKRHFIILAALLLFSGNALACTAEGSRIAAENREEGRLKLRKVRGTYEVLSVTRRTEKQFGEEFEVSTLHGRITNRSGRTYETIHEDDGSIILCATFYRPGADAKGVFFLERIKGEPAKRYRLMDWDGSYIEKPPTSEVTPKVSE